MKTKDFLAGMAIGLLAGIVLMLGLSHNYMMETGGGDKTPIMRLNTITGKTWSLDVAPSGGVRWKEFE
jgi:hypothetical protein